MDTAQVVDTAEAADTAEAVAAVDRFGTAFDAQDVDAIMAAMTPDCVFECVRHGRMRFGFAKVSRNACQFRQRLVTGLVAFDLADNHGAGHLLTAFTLLVRVAGGNIFAPGRKVCDCKLVRGEVGNRAGDLLQHFAKR